MSPEAELLRALRSGSGDVASHSAWLDLFLQLAQGRIASLRDALGIWQASADAVLPFSALRQADELSGLCAEQASTSLSELSAALAAALRRHSGLPATPEQRQATVAACDELWRQLHQHAAGVTVVTPTEVLQKL
ncbi:MAG: hypothetical protein QM527_12395 [Alphaproteobacteria bacterium]|nr:hypothetical protein [Alphaproteobacteria bacterium]